MLLEVVPPTYLSRKIVYYYHLAGTVNLFLIVVAMTLAEMFCQIVRKSEN